MPRIWVPFFKSFMGHAHSITSKSQINPSTHAGHAPTLAVTCESAPQCPPCCDSEANSLRSRTSSVLIRSSSRVSGNWVSGSPRSCSDSERSMKNTRMACMNSAESRGRWDCSHFGEMLHMEKSHRDTGLKTKQSPPLYLSQYHGSGAFRARQKNPKHRQRHSFFSVIHVHGFRSGTLSLNWAPVIC